MDIQIWNPDDVEIVTSFVETLTLVFPQSNHTVENFLWKHQQNPLGPSIITYARSDNGEIAAIRAFWRCPLNYQGEEIIAYQPCDTATHINYRRQGLFEVTTDYALKVAKEKQCQLVFNFPVLASKLGYLKLGWRDFGGLLALVKPVNKLNVIYFLIKNKKLSNHRFVQSEKNLDSFEDKELDLDLLEDILKVQGFFDTTMVHGYGSLDYIRWRFFQNPRWYYIVKNYKDILIIAKLGQRNSLKELAIVSIYTSLSQDLKKNIKYMLDNFIQQYEVDFLSYYIHKDHPLANIFLQLGFFKFPTRANFVALPLDSRIPLNDMKWAIQAGDMDTF